MQPRHSPLHFLNPALLLQTYRAALAFALFYLALFAAQGQIPTIQFTDENQIRLDWNALDGKMEYTVQSLGQVRGNYWRPRGDAETWPRSELFFLDSVTNDPARFYRVVGIERGRLVSAEFQEEVSPFVIAFAAAALGVEILPTHTVQIYRIEYETVDVFLGRTIASGIVALPIAPSSAMPLVSYQHGTIYLDADQPSTPGARERLIAAGMASIGYATALPDLLGLGTDSGAIHPYVHRRSEATAVIDLLRAVRQFVSTQPTLELNGQVLLTGYSQGGHATLAAQKAIEENHQAEFSLTASAPMAGPYDISGTMTDIMFGPNAFNAPEYLPYVTIGFNLIYGLADDLSEILKEPYASTLPLLFDGTHSGEDIAAAMPSNVPRDTIDDSFAAEYQSNPNHPLRLALQDNDLLAWAPQTPTRMFHCAGDTTVPIANTQRAYDSFIARGVSPDLVQQVDPDPSADHTGCVGPALNLVIQWFETFR